MCGKNFAIRKLLQYKLYFFLNNNESVPIELNLLSSVKGYMDFSSFLRTTITCITCRKIENKDLKIVFHNSTISTENVLLNIW